MASATASLPLGAQARRGRTFVALAAVAWSTAGILQRELSVGIGTQVAGRALFAMLGLLAYVAFAERGAVVPRVPGSRARGARRCGAPGHVVRLVHHRPEPRVGREHPLHAGARAGACRRLRMLVGEPVPAHLDRDRRCDRRRGADGRRPGQAARARLRALGPDDHIVCRHARAHAAPPGGFDGACDLPFASARPRVRCAVRASRPGWVADLVLLVSLGVGQIGLGFVFLTIGGRLIPAAEVALITLLEVVLGPSGSGSSARNGRASRRSSAAWSCSRPSRSRRAAARSSSACPFRNATTAAT